MEAQIMNVIDRVGTYIIFTCTRISAFQNHTGYNEVKASYNPINEYANVSLNILKRAEIYKQPNLYIADTETNRFWRV